MTQLIKVDAVNPDPALIRIAADVILKGGLLAFPTETVYGLGASTYNDDAIRRIYIVKNRPMDNPSIVHISSFNQLHEVAEDVPSDLEERLKVAWPGPLTVILRKSSRISEVASCGLSTVAVRMPAHPIPLALIRESTPISAPSANISGKPSPTRAEHVIRDLWGKIDLIIDGGETFFGVESTIIDYTKKPPILYRPGPFTVEELRRIFGEIKVPEQALGLGQFKEALAPGMKYRHYAPDKPLIVSECSSLDGLVKLTLDLASDEAKKGKQVVVLCSSETCSIYVNAGFRVIEVGSRNNLYTVAKNLFHSLRLIDSMNVDLAVAEGYPEIGIGLAVMNRLRKASGYNIVKCSA
ncbi:L-threonylcarbamoyladenylate synthase [Caldivirga sp. UBA161]|uniref:L-threonylcarbamoyladenylate synthase n=1 Tax=Caldivirga sp. UBA161 TaxID=1915569 RepID=UPI0025C6B8CF|nr:L-threonylcarbamoyladenylate synthase [Caldivirga sp. UBA161]